MKPSLTVVAFLFVFSISILDVQGDPGYVIIRAEEGSKIVQVKIKRKDMDREDAISALSKFLDSQFEPLK